MQGDDSTVASDDSFYNFRCSADPCVTASDITVTHDLTVDEDKILSIGSGYVLYYECSAAGDYNNNGSIMSPGAIAYSFTASDVELDIGAVYANVWVVGNASASADRTLTLATDTTFGRAL